MTTSPLVQTLTRLVHFLKYSPDLFSQADTRSLLWGDAQTPTNMNRRGKKAFMFPWMDVPVKVRALVCGRSHKRCWRDGPESHFPSSHQTDDSQQRGFQQQTFHRIDFHHISSESDRGGEQRELNHTAQCTCHMSHCRTLLSSTGCTLRYLCQWKMAAKDFFIFC